MLEILDSLPEGFLDCDTAHLHEVLAGSTLIHLPGRRSEPLFISVLLHGNETTGFIAAQELLRKYADSTLPRAVSLLVGNVEAARNGMRRLDEQPDFNRIWRDGERNEHDMTRITLEEMRRRDVFASIDIHNNTGVNPHYACVNHIDHRFFYLASLFSRTVVYFLKPDGVQSMAFSELCPAVTLECGRPGEPYGVEHARDYLDTCLHLDEFPEKPLSHNAIDLFHTVATVRVPQDVSFSFRDSGADIRFVEDLDHLNFCELPPNTTLGWIREGSGARLEVLDEQGHEVGTRYFDFSGGEILTGVVVMPSMLTLDEQVIRQDCLCYLMERMDVNWGRGG